MHIIIALFLRNLVLDQLCSALNMFLLFILSEGLCVFIHYYSCSCVCLITFRRLKLIFKILKNPVYFLPLLLTNFHKRAKSFSLYPILLFVFGVTIYSISGLLLSIVKWPYNLIISFQTFKNSSTLSGALFWIHWSRFYQVWKAGLLQFNISYWRNEVPKTTSLKDFSYIIQFFLMIEKRSVVSSFSEVFSETFRFFYFSIPLVWIICKTYFYSVLWVCI